MTPSSVRALDGSRINRGAIELGKLVDRTDLNDGWLLIWSIIFSEFQTIT